MKRHVLWIIEEMEGERNHEDEHAEETMCTIEAEQAWVGSKVGYMIGSGKLGAS
jgi:hypothetical protein